MEREYSQKYLQINRGKGIVFDAPETPFTYVNPELSDLGENPSLRIKLMQNFPRLSFFGAYTIDGALIIQDINSESTTTNRTKQLNLLAQITLQIVDASSASRDLEALIDPEVTKDAPLVFPGEGAKEMLKFLPSGNKQERLFVPTTRTMIKPGKFKLDINYSELPNIVESPWILIFDDVVATGQTTSTIAKEFKRRYPSIKCAVATWIMVEPRNDVPSGILGVDRVFAAMVVRGNYVNQPPINSLSCFVRNFGKYESVKKRFMEKYIRDGDSFDKALIELGGTK